MIYDLCGIYPYMIHPWFIHCLPASDVDRLKMDVGRHAPGLAQLSDQHGIFWSCWLWGLGQCDAHVNMKQVSILGCNLQIFIAVCKDVFTFSETGFCWSCTLRPSPRWSQNTNSSSFASLWGSAMAGNIAGSPVPLVWPVKAWCYSSVTARDWPVACIHKRGVTRHDFDAVWQVYVSSCLYWIIIVQCIYCNSYITCIFFMVYIYIIY